MKAVSPTLADLVAIPSINPMGTLHKGGEFGERRVASYVKQFLEHLGADSSGITFSQTVQMSSVT